MLVLAATAFATAGYSHPTLFRELAKAATARLDDFRPPSAIALLKAFAAAGFYSRHATADLLTLMEADRLAGCSASDLADLAWALSTLRVLPASHPWLLQELARQARLRLTDFRPQALLRLVTTLASLGALDAELLGAAAGVMSGGGALERLPAGQVWTEALPALLLLPVCDPTPIGCLPPGLRPGPGAGRAALRRPVRPPVARVGRLRIPPGQPERARAGGPGVGPGCSGLPGTRRV